MTTNHTVPPIAYGAIYEEETMGTTERVRVTLEEALAGLSRGYEDLRDLEELVVDQWRWEDAAQMIRVIAALQARLEGGEGVQTAGRGDPGAAPTETEPNQYDDYWGWLRWNHTDEELVERLETRAGGMDYADGSLLNEAARRLRTTRTEGEDATGRKLREAVEHGFWWGYEAGWEDGRDPEVDREDAEPGTPWKIEGHDCLAALEEERG